MKHKAYVCLPDCAESYCPYCQGGMFCCIHCGAAEGAATQHCPGTKVDAVTWDKVYRGELDYVDGNWITGNGDMPCHTYKIEIEHEQ